MNNIDEGSVVVCSTTQAGTVIQLGSEVWVLLQNGDIWTGPAHGVRVPQDQADLDACPLEVERFIEREKIKRVDRD